MKKQVFNLSKVVGVPSPMGRARVGVKQKVAFTLAEVLITLGVIGVVAAITMPTLISNYQKHVTINRLKQTYTILYGAIKRSEADNGDLNLWNFELHDWQFSANICFRI